MSLGKWIRQAGAPSESDSARDGVLSYSAEVHALALGLGAGVVTALLLVLGHRELSALPAVAVVGWALGIRKVPKGADSHVRDVAREPAYAVGGVAVGVVVVLALAAVLGAPMPLLLLL